MQTLQRRMPIQKQTLDAFSTEDLNKTLLRPPSCTPKASLNICALPHLVEAVAHWSHTMSHYSSLPAVAIKIDLRRARTG